LTHAYLIYNMFFIFFMWQNTFCIRLVSGADLSRAGCGNSHTSSGPNYYFFIQPNIFCILSTHSHSAEHTHAFLFLLLAQIVPCTHATHTNPPTLKL